MQPVLSPKEKVVQLCTKCPKVLFNVHFGQCATSTGLLKLKITVLLLRALIHAKKILVGQITQKCREGTCSDFLSINMATKSKISQCKFFIEWAATCQKNSRIRFPKLNALLHIAHFQPNFFCCYLYVFCHYMCIPSAQDCSHPENPHSDHVRLLPPNYE